MSPWDRWRGNGKDETVTLFSVVLFAHIVATLGLFAGLAIEWLILFGLRRPAGPVEARTWIELWPKLGPMTIASAALLIVSGIYLATKAADWSQGWIQVSLVGLLLIAPLGAVAGRRMRAMRDGHAAVAALGLLISCRTAIALGVVMLMTTQPGLPESVVVIAIALGGGLICGFGIRNGRATSAPAVEEDSMKIAVLGATGGTGLEIVRQAVERGHTVTALVRSPEKLRAFGDSIAVMKGDLLDSDQLEPALQGQDAVVSGFGPRVPISKADAHLLQTFAGSLTSAMRRAGIRRVVVESVAFLFKDSIIPPAYALGRLFFRDLIADSSEMERVIAASGLDWTIVRPPKLTDKPRTGKYRVREGHLPPFGFSISRADVADFILKAAENHAATGKVVGVCN